MSAPEALTLDPQAQLHMQQPDMTAFETEFSQPAAGAAELGEQAQQTPEHDCSVGCDHFHAEAHVDHPEDHHTPAADTHEAGHDHAHHQEKHVHGPGCGHVEHEQAHEHVDRHVHSERCGHLHHGEAKTHIDHAHEAKHDDHHHETGHVHHEGCGHVGHEKAQAHVDKPHVHDAHCGHLHHAEADTHIDHAAAAKHEAHDHSSKEHVHRPGCGHVGYEHAHTEHADHARVHQHDHIAETVRAEAHRMVEDSHVHEQEAAARHLREAERPIAHEQHADAERVQHDQIAAVQQERYTLDHLEAQRRAVPDIETQTNEVMVEALSKYVADAVDRDDLRLSEQAAAYDPVAMERRTMVTDEQDDTTHISEAVVEVVMEAADIIDEGQALPPAESTAEQPLLSAAEAIMPPQPEAAPYEPATAEAFEPADIPDLALVESVPFQEDDMTTPFATRELPDMPTARLPEAVKQGDTLAAITDITDAIVERIDTAESEAATDSPERRELVQATVAKLRANLASSVSAGRETLPPEVHREFVQLLRQLGFAGPEQTLGMYMSQYGYDFLDEMLLRLFELLNKSASFEVNKLHSPVPTMQQPQTTGSVAIGKFALQLLAAAQTKLARADRRMSPTSGRLTTPSIAI